MIAMTVLAYGPALQAGFVWDDDDYVTENPLLTAPDGLRRIWLSTDAPSQYFPAVYTTFRLERALWGLDPFGYHLVNVLLHAANALLVWLVLSRLALPGAWLAAAIFALHPVHVESVAWISERKNVLSLFFFLASLLAWLRYTNAQLPAQPGAYASALLLYVLALASKMTACTLPAAMLLVLWLDGRRIDRRRVLQVAPFLVLGVLMGIVAILWERFHIGTVGERFSLSLVEAVLVASRALWFYLGKLLWPVQLTFSYPRFDVDPSDPLQYAWPIAGGVLFWALWRWRSRIGRAPLVAALFFVSTLSPMLGFIPLFTFWYTFVADHYQYVASIGPIALFAGGAATWVRGRDNTTARLARAAAALLLLVLGGLVWSQSRIYENEEVLWRDTIAKHPASWMARTNLARALSRQERFDEAAAAYRGALEIRPETYRAHLGLAHAAARLGREEEAIEHTEAALEIAPRLYVERESLAALRWRRGEKEAALRQYEAMIGIAPRNPLGHLLLARALGRMGRVDEATARYRMVLALDPDHAEARRVLSTGGGR